MLNRVLFVERSGELRWLARLSTKGVEPKGNQVDVLDEAHGYTFIADTYSGSDGNQPGVIDVKIRIFGINVMFLLLHLIMYATFGPIVLSGFTLICFSLLPLFLRQCRLRGGLFGCV